MRSIQQVTLSLLGEAQVHGEADFRFKQAMITLQEIAVFNSLYCLKGPLHARFEAALRNI